jgi:hypothetical protein
MLAIHVEVVNSDIRGTKYPLYFSGMGVTSERPKSLPSSIMSISTQTHNNIRILPRFRSAEG